MQIQLASIQQNGAYLSIGTYDIVHSNIFSGYGVGVGILEMGIIDKNHANLVNTRKIVIDNWYLFPTKTEHTTIMAALIADTNGIAQGALIVSAELNGTPNDEVDWMLDNYVDIINMSYGKITTAGKYSSQSAYMDYIVYTYKITMVAASGNEGDTTGYVGNPGLGYNVITVGASNSAGNAVMSFSSSVVVNGPYKPTFVAPGNLIYV